MAKPDHSITYEVDGKKVTTVVENSPPGVDVANQEGSGSFVLATYTKDGDEDIKRFETERQRRYIDKVLEKGMKINPEVATDTWHEPSA